MSHNALFWWKLQINFFKTFWKYTDFRARTVPLISPCFSSLSSILRCLNNLTVVGCQITFVTRKKNDYIPKRKERRRNPYPAVPSREKLSSHSLKSQCWHNQEAEGGKKKNKKSSNNAEGGIPSKYNREREELGAPMLKMDCHRERKLADHRTEAGIRLLSIRLCDQDKSVQIPLCYITTRWSW